MKKVLSIILLIVFASTGNALAARNITFPHSETFEASNSIDDLSWTAQGGTVTRVQESWRGGTNYAAKIVPPNCCDAACTGGQNGTYASLGTLNFSSTSTLNISFAFFTGTSLNGEKSLCPTSGGTYWKFINIHNTGSDWAAMARWVDIGGSYELTAVDFGGAEGTICYDGTATGNIDWDCENSGRVFMDDGAGGAGDIAGEWIWINYIVSSSATRMIVYTRDGAYSGDYFNWPVGSNGSMADFFINYFNGYFPGRDSNTYMLIDDIYVTNSTTPHTVPTGFVEGEDTTPPTVDTVSIGTNGTTVSLTFSESVTTTGYDNGDFDLVCSTAGTVALNSISGTGSSRTLTAASTVYSGDTCTLSFDGATDEIQDTAGNDLADFTLKAVTNNSTATPSDTTDPAVSGLNPSASATNISKSTSIVAHVTDAGAGVDQSSIVMTVEGASVTPSISGTAADYTLTYNPVTDFAYDQVVNVTIDADDLAETPNSMTQYSYSFTIMADPGSGGGSGGHRFQGISIINAE